MSQLQKKSFVASVTGHFLLLAVLLVGPAGLVAGCSQYNARNRSVPIVLPSESNGGYYAQVTKAVYEEAWRVPDDFTNKEATVKVLVTVSRNGVVAASQILKRSAVPELDTSIEAVLDRVKSIGRPFPEGDPETQRTFIINFNLKAKRLL